MKMIMSLQRYTAIKIFFSIEKEKISQMTKPFCPICEIFYGWAERIRTSGMLESESSALPLGDSPI